MPSPCFQRDWTGQRVGVGPGQGAHTALGHLLWARAIRCQLPKPWDTSWKQFLIPRGALPSTVWG